jgi:hypothetical protein
MIIIIMVRRRRRRRSLKNTKKQCRWLMECETIGQPQ